VWGLEGHRGGVGHPFLLLLVLARSPAIDDATGPPRIPGLRGFGAWRKRSPVVEVEWVEHSEVVPAPLPVDVRAGWRETDSERIMDGDEHQSTGFPAARRESVERP
jgi:hypothetical protein